MGHQDTERKLFEMPNIGVAPSATGLVDIVLAYNGIPVMATQPNWADVDKTAGLVNRLSEDKCITGICMMLGDKDFPILDGRYTSDHLCLVLMNLVSYYEGDRSDTLNVCVMNINGHAQYGMANSNDPAVAKELADSLLTNFRKNVGSSGQRQLKAFTKRMAKHFR